jgi:outer membrane receptor protein involved in Fe transport
MAWGQIDQDSSPQAAQGREGGEEEIIVTGSRIPSPNATRSTPVMVVSGENLEQRGEVNLADAIKTIPAVGATALAPSAQPRDTLNLGLFAVDLRALGATRTLVLVNGRRHVAGLPGTSIVDINTLPVDLIDRIEVTTGGASAVYGSDALAGVVNVIMKDNFDGLQLRSQYGISSRGDGSVFKASLLGGANFADGRGNATLFASYDRNDQIRAKAREFSREPLLLTNFLRPDLALRGPAALNARSTIPGVFGLNANTAQAATIVATVLPDGTVTTPSGPRDALDPQSYVLLLNPNERFLLGGNFQFELSDGIDLFVETAFSRADVLQRFEPTFIRSGTLNLGGTRPGNTPIRIPVTNPFIPAAIRALIPANRTDIAIGRVFPEFGPRETDHSRNLYRIVGGLRGELPILGSDWNWEAYYQFGRTNQHQHFRNGINTLNFFEGLRVEPDGAGGFRCASPAARTAGCVPLNLFTGRALTQAEQNFLRADATIDAENTQQVAAATIGGNLFELPAGPVGLAVGVEWRREESSYRPSDLLQNGQISLQFVGPTKGEFTVKEAFAEVRVPLLSDIPVIDYLELEGAFRIANYSTSGTSEAWKIGGTYRPIRDLRLRSVLARAVRAPQIAELFAGAQSSILNIADPCAGGGTTPARRTNCLTFPGVTANFNPGPFNPVLVTFGGNPALEPETAKTWTVGGVLQPRFLSNLALSVDYFRIKIDNGIGSLPAQLTINLCADTGAAGFCSFATRDPLSGILTNFSAAAINVSEELMRGVDVQLDYSTALGSLGGRLNVGLDYSHLIEYKTTSFPGATPVENVRSIPYPQDRGNLRLSYENSGFNLATNVRYIGKVLFVNSEKFEQNDIKPRVYTDVQLRYTFNEQHSLYVGANNVFDRDPPLVPVNYFGASSGPNTAASVYDIVGRFFYAGFSAKF